LSRYFYPINEVRGEPSACFMECENVVRLFHEVAATAGTSSEESIYGEVTSVWIEDGKKFLDYVAHDEEFGSHSVEKRLAEQGVTVELGDLDSLIGNMKNLVDEWRHSIREHGDLIFYVG
jgi:hypothetical protein